jgi:hypothetical protein
VNGVGGPGVGESLSLDQLLQSNDGLTKAAEMFAEVAGRELSRDALQCLLFLEENGSGDLALRVVALKRFQASTRDIIDLVEKLSPAQATKDLMEHQSKMFQGRGQ